jgi:hypothetical protein
MDKKIIDKKNIKDNNPNDDEEILKNNEEAVKDITIDAGTVGSKDENVNTQSTGIIQIP